MGINIKKTRKIELPLLWELVPLGNILLKIIGGGTPSKKIPEYYKGNIPWFTVKDMRTRRPFDSIDHISKKAVKESSTNIIPENTVIIATRIGLGRVIRVPFVAAINQDLKALFTTPEIDKGYLEYWFVSIADYLDSIGSGTTVKGIRLEILKELQFPLAPLNDQKRIVAEIEKQFSRLDEAVDNLKRVKANLKRYKASVLKAAVEGKLTEVWRKDNPDVEPAAKLLERILVERRKKWEKTELAKMKAKGKVPKDDKWKKKYKGSEKPETENLPDIPAIWLWARLDSVAEIKGGITKDSKRKIKSAKELPYLRVANVQRGYLDLDKIKYIKVPEDEVPEILLKKGDILFNEGGDRDKLGRGWVWEGQINKCTYQNHVFRARLYLNKINGKLFSWYGNTFGQQYFIAKGKQTTNLASINKTMLSAFPIPLPPFDEQVVLIKEVEGRLSMIDAVEKEVEINLMRAERLRQSILKKAFSGNLLVNRYDNNSKI